jgi:hypothetical protein
MKALQNSSVQLHVLVSILQASAREDRKAWQQRLQTMELELKSNKQHIQQLMQQLHAIEAKQVPIKQPDLETTVASALQHSPPQRLHSRVSMSAGGPSTSSSASSSGMQEESSIRFDQGDQADFCSQHQQPASRLLQRASPLGDATNRVNISSASRWPQYSSAPYSSSPTSKQKTHRPRRGSQTAADENTVPDTGLQLQDGAAAAVVALGEAHQQQLYHNAMQLQGLALQQQQDSKQLIDVQQRMEELQLRARQLEAENEQLKSAHAAASAQIDSLKLMQQAEQLKQVGGCWSRVKLGGAVVPSTLQHLATCSQQGLPGASPTNTKFSSCICEQLPTCQHHICFAGTHGLTL